MKPSAPNEAEELSARQITWRIAAAMLIGLIGLNALAVILTLSPFTTLFFISNGLNLILAVALLGDKAWGRILTLIRAALGIVLALPLGPSGQRSAPFDLLVTALLLGGIFLTLIGPPHHLKTALGVTLFIIGVAGTILAVLVFPVTAG